MKDTYRILLLSDNSRGFGRGIMRGFTRYAALHGRLQFLYRQPGYLTEQGGLAVEEFRHRQLDGILCSISQSARLAELGLPMVCYDLGNYEGPLPCITSDDEQVGRQAAEFLIRKGYRSFAYSGFDSLRWSKSRRIHFTKTLQEAGYPLSTLTVTEPYASLADEEEALKRWIASIPKPAALFCANDDRALALMEICASLGLKIPDELAVLGADNDDLLCQSCHPALSSVQISSDQAGYDAAELLTAILDGKARSEGQRLVASVAGVAERQSTNVLMVEHPTVRKALHFITENIHRPLQVSEVVKDAGRSHRALNDLFHSELGCSIGKSITQARIQHISKLLTDTNLRIQEIAIAAGYDDDRHFSRYFKRSTGMTPLEYRRTVKMP